MKPVKTSLMWSVFVLASLLITAGCRRESWSENSVKIQRLEREVEKPHPSKAVIEQLLVMMRSPNSLEATNAAALLKTVGLRCPTSERAKVIAALRRMLVSGDPNRQFQAVCTLTAYGAAPRSIQPSLRNVIKNGGTRSCIQAIAVLGNLGGDADGRSVDLLISVIERQDDASRNNRPSPARSAAIALGKIAHGTAEQLAQLRRLMRARHGALQMRLAYVVAVISPGDKAALRILKRGEATSNTWVKKLANQELKALHGRRPNGGRGAGSVAGSVASGSFPVGNNHSYAKVPASAKRP